jgi:WD40 repeat protein
VRLWDEAMTEVPIGDMPVCVRTVSGKEFVVGCRSGALRLFEWTSQLAVIEVAVAPVLAMHVADEGAIVLAACDDNHIRVVDIATEAVVKEVGGHERGISGVCVTGDGEWMITTGNDGSVGVWRMGSFDLVDTTREHATKFGEGALCCAAMGRNVGRFGFATAGTEGDIKLHIKG